MEKNEKPEGTEGIEEAEVVEAEKRLPAIRSAMDIFEDISDIEKRVLAKLESRVTDPWAYEFPQGGKTVRGLSSVGARETALLLAQESGAQIVIKEIPGTLKIEKRDESYSATVMAGLYITGIRGDKVIQVELQTASGFADQERFGHYADNDDNRGKGRVGQEYEDGHADSKAVTKAQRNAFSKLLPDKLKKAVIERALKLKRMAKSDPDSAREPNGGHPTGHSGNGKATEKQIAYIKKLILSSKISTGTRDTIEKELKKEISFERADSWIRMLKPKVEGTETKKSEEGQGTLIE